MSFIGQSSRRQNSSARVLFYFGGFASVGGIETFCRNLLSHLKFRGFDCVLVCWGKESSLLGKLALLGVKVIRSSLRWGCKWNFPDWLLLPIGIRQIQNADIVLFGKLFPLRILEILKQNSSNSTQFVYITPYKPEVPVPLLERQYLLKSLSLFDLILVQASSFESNLQKIGYDGTISIIPYIPQQVGVLQDFPYGSEFKIGFLGRLVEDKNLPLLLKAFRFFYDRYFCAVDQPNKAYSTASLHIFGNGYLRQELEELTQQLGLESLITFHGEIANDQVESAIASCHLFAFTSRSEGQCLAALEILSCGRPVVATDVGAFSEILLSSCLGEVVKNADPEIFADNLIKVMKRIEQSELSPDLVRSSYLERYDPDRVGDRYVELLNALCLRNA